MDIHSVLVEALDTRGSEVFKSCGFLVNNYIFTTFPFEPLLDNDLRKIKERTTEITDRDLNITKLIFVITMENKFLRAKFSRYFISDKIKESARKIFRFWSLNVADNYNFDILSMFIILKLENSMENLTDEIKVLLKKIPENLTKGRSLQCKSAAFASRNFLNHYSEGIISNISGVDKCLIFSDLPLTPGCEGSPVFCDSSQIPIGIVISTTNWWKGEWLNFTVIADFRQLLLEIEPTNLRRTFQDKENSQISNLIELGLFQIYNENIWGTAILIDKKNGIFITNAHVVENKKIVPLHNKNKTIHCDVIYSSPTGIDVAILKSKFKLDKRFQSINLSRKTLKNGDPVYAAGFPIFPKESNAGFTLTKGRVIHIDQEMIKTTCSVYRGASGGAILDEDGGLVALIVCNAETKGRINMVYPRFNMNIPVALLIPFIRKYIDSGDILYLEKIALINTRSWSLFSKL